MNLTCDPPAEPLQGGNRVDVSLVIPVFNSVASLHRLHQAVRASCASVARGCEIVYVDDGSRDGSLELLREFARHSPEVRVVAHSRNRGQSKAVLTGIRAACGNIIVTLDDDLQHQPHHVPALLAMLDTAGPSTLVMGVAASLKRPIWRGLLGPSANFVSNLFLSKPLPLQLTTFCAFRRHLCAYFDSASDIDLPLTTALVQAAGETRTLPIEMAPSLRGRSRYGIASLVRLFLSRTRFYSLPRVLTWTSAAALFSLAVAFPIFHHNLAASPVTAALLLPSTTVTLALALLAFRVKRQTDPYDLLRANRPA